MQQKFEHEEVMKGLNVYHVVGALPKNGGYAHFCMKNKTKNISFINIYVQRNYQYVKNLINTLLKINLKTSPYYIFSLHRSSPKSPDKLICVRLGFSWVSDTFIANRDHWISCNALTWNCGYILKCAPASEKLIIPCLRYNIFVCTFSEVNLYPSVGIKHGMVGIWGW